MYCIAASFPDRLFRVARSSSGVIVAILILLAAQPAAAQLSSQATVTGVVLDSLGGRVAGATVTLVRESVRGAQAATNARGEFSFERVAAGRHQVEVSAQGFTARASAPFYVALTSRHAMDVTLQVGPLVQDVVVSAAAADLPQSQVGASISVIDRAQIEISGKLDLFDAVRAVPGAQIVQTGGRGGATSLFVRGGHPGFTKVLVDGVPMNDIGGTFNFADLEATGVDRVEVLRGSNSVLYGLDALSGVVNVTTSRGRSVRPEVSFSTDGGNLGTSHHAASAGGAFKRFDYFGAYSRLDTDNHLPNNSFRNDTLAGRIGVAIGSGTVLSVTARRTVSDVGLPNAVAYFGVADDSLQQTAFTTMGATVQSQVSPKLMTTLRMASSVQALESTNPTPTGEAFDPFDSGFPNYLGDLVTIRGANGTSTSGRAVLDFGGVYPSVYDSRTARQSLSGQADYQVHAALNLAGGLRYDREHGETESGSVVESTRDTVGAFVEARAALHRVYVNAGLGYDHNSVFGSAMVPRVSVAAYLRAPAAAAGFGETKLTFNAGKGIKAPSVAQELSSLFALIQAAPGLDGVWPIGPEKSTGLDVGIEQALAGNHLKVRAAVFSNRFEDLIEYVSNTALPRLGVPEAVANATGFGAYVNASSYDARGLETSVEAALWPGMRMMASYMYLDTEVTQSFASSALGPSFNPAYPDIPIGAYSPLVGGRAFRRPANSGHLTVSYAHRRVQAYLSGYFSGKFDESTFMSDAFFGSSLLLPNRDFGAAYRKLDASAAYAITPRLRAFVTVENLADSDYEAAAGFPALPRTVRAGLKVTLGGGR